MEIKIENLKKQFAQKVALDIPALDIKQGELVGIVGNNGAGKTTLFRLLLDLIEASSGSVRLNDIPVARNDSWKSFTGSFLDEGFLIDFLTPEEYFYFCGSLYGLNKQETDASLTRYERFMSGEIMGQNKLVRNLSTGNKQKVGIIAAMFVNPGLLILDEPFNFLDPSSQIMVKRMLQKENLTRNTTMLISSHNLNHITDICSRIILLEKGKIIKDLSPTKGDLAEIEEYFSSEEQEEGGSL